MCCSLALLEKEQADDLERGRPGTLGRAYSPQRQGPTTNWSERGMDKVVLGIRGQRVAQLER
jgi:hypothetical protein